MNEKYKKEKEFKIKQLKKEIAEIEKLLKNSGVGLFTGNDLSVLRNILQKNKNYLHKLESNEFEIAIVGLEKAGKSTFANALIASNFLPSAPERCTFTSTRLVYGSDKAVIKLYNESEFNNIFQELLSSVEYPDAKNQNFRNMTIEEFKNYFENELKIKNPNLYQVHNNKTNKEIEDILKNKDELELTGETLEFEGEQLTQDTFREYIRGIKIGKITNTAKPRSVKDIAIESSKLNRLKTAIIYDVPGFDSPTKIHENQTRERLQQADAIILISNAGDKPNINAPQLDTLQKDTDIDGIPLKDKLFVFGNKIDTANSLEIAENNIDVFVEDVVNTHKIAEEKRVFVGSALKYLKDNNLTTEEYHSKFEIDDNIDNIRSAIEKYYENERFEILKKKIDSNSDTFREILKNIIKNNDEDFDEDFAEHKKTSITSETIDKIKENLEKTLRDFNYNLREDFEKNKYFSDKFKSLLETDEEVSNNYFPLIEENDIQQAKIYTSKTVSSEIPIDKMNPYIREKKYSEYLKRFSELIINMTSDKTKEVEKELLNSFVKALNVYNETLLEEKLKLDTQKFIQKLTNNQEFNEDKFTYLVERFSRHLFDILILYPLLSDSRKQKFEKSQQEFIYLSTFYGDKATEFISMLLTGEKGNAISMEDLIKLVQKGIAIIQNPYNIKDRVEDLRDIFNSLQQLDTTKISYNVDEITKDKKAASTEKELLEEINRDIENLKEILKQAVVPAMNLELAFYNGINKQVDLMIETFKSTNSEYYKEFNSFISKISNIVAENKLKNIKTEIEKQQKLKEIKEYINSIIKD